MVTRAPPIAAAPVRRRPPASSAAVLAAAIVLSSTGAWADNPNMLWDIVHDRCVPDLQTHGDPKPCAMVALEGGIERGYAVLKDLRGVAQFLLIPTARISGIEDPQLLRPGAPNYFAAAWRARTYVEASVRRALPRDSISLAVNSIFARSQNQLHIHIDCIRADVRDTLRAHAWQIGEQWAPLDAPLAGHRYMAMRVLGEELGPANPFELLADGIPRAKEDMGRHTLVVTGATFAEAGPGFIVLDDRADPAAGDRGSGEDLQDHACALADRSPAGDVPR